MDYIQVVISFISSLIPFAYLIYGLGRIQERIEHMAKSIDELVRDKDNIHQRITHHKNKIDECLDSHQQSIARHDEAISTLKKKAGI